MNAQEALDNVIKCARSVQGSAEFHEVLAASIRVVVERMQLADKLEKDAAERATEPPVKAAAKA